MSSSQSSNTTSDSEISPLMASATSSNNSGNGAENNNGNYYFLNSNETFKPSQQSASRTIPEVEKLPYGATEDEFASRPIMGSATTERKKVGFFSRYFNSGSTPRDPSSQSITIGSLMKKRQAAIKIEPKIFFANERTFLAWLHSSVLLAGASVAMVSLSEDNVMSQLYGIILLPVSIAFMCYSMHQYGRRAQLIRRRAPGPYEDIIGPAVLAVTLMLSIVAQFSIRLYFSLAVEY